VEVNDLNETVMAALAYEDYVDFHHVDNNAYFVCHVNNDSSPIVFRHFFP